MGSLHKPNKRSLPGYSADPFTTPYDNPFPQTGGENVHVFTGAVIHSFITSNRSPVTAFPRLLWHASFALLVSSYVNLYTSISKCFTVFCSKRRSTTLSSTAELPCSPDDEDCVEFSGDLKLATAPHLVFSASMMIGHSVLLSRASGKPTSATHRLTLGRSGSITKVTMTAPSAITYDQRQSAYIQSSSPGHEPPQPSVYPHDAATTRLDEINQLKLNVALIFGVTICLCMLLLTFVLVLCRYRTSGGLVRGRRPRSGRNKAAAVNTYETCNTLPPLTPVSVNRGRPLIVGKRIHSGQASVVSRPPLSDATNTVAGQDVKEWFVWRGTHLHCLHLLTFRHSTSYTTTPQDGSIVTENVQVS